MPPIIKTTKNIEHTDSMIIGAGHSIMAGYIPPSIPLTEFSEKFYQWAKTSPESIAKFGFWGGEIDYNTYYPSLSPEELKPKDEEFIEPMFRLLSATIVSKNYNPTDFGQAGVLKASMQMLLGQTVNCDHETNIGNAIGAVSKVVWQEAYKDGNFIIPAGINGVLKIDGKANPRIARGILMEPPSIHSNSVTVQFKWDKSHPEMSDQDFYQKLGTYDSKGNMIRRMVTEVVRYLETSLVSHGADTFAQKIGEDGKIINPEFAKRTWNSYAEYQEDKAKVYAFSDSKSLCKNNDTQQSFIEQTTTSNSNNNIMDIQAFISAMLALNVVSLAEGAEQTPENFLSAFKAYTDNNKNLGTQVASLTAEVNTLKDKLSASETQVANLNEMATVGKNHIASLRETAVANYKKLKGDNADETIVTMLNSDTTGLATLISLNKEYENQLNEKFPMTCAKCGSHDVSRASSVKEDDKEDTTSNQEEVSTASVMKNLIHKALKA